MNIHLIDLRSLSFYKCYQSGIKLAYFRGKNSK